MAATATLAFGGQVPVLLELFTSEGCSSCPPADRLLELFDREQPVAGADLIVLSEHVDYWNHLGWADPYSSATFSQRQRDYAGRLGSGGVYTPQLVVDGKKEFVGSDRAKAMRAVQDAIREPKLEIALTAARAGNEAEIHFNIGPVKNATVYIALADDRARSQVARGENAGRSLDHVAVAYSVMKVAATNGATGLQKDLRVPVKASPVRIVVFAQNPSSGRVLGVAQVKL